MKHLKFHTRLVQMAVAWDERKRDKGMLIGSDHIQEATDWLLLSALGREPRPSRLLLDFLTERCGRQWARACRPPPLTRPGAPRAAKSATR